VDDLGIITTKAEVPASFASRSWTRANLVLRDLDHGGPSYEVRVFVQNPAANGLTELDDEHGYAGSVFVYGQGPGDQPIPVDRSIDATDILRQSRAALPEVTAVAIPLGPAPAGVATPWLRNQRITIELE
jgi:hypothetical protein